MKTKLAVTLASSTLLVGGCKQAANPPTSAPPPAAAQAPIFQAEDFADLTKEALKELLAKVREALGLPNGQTQRPMSVTCYYMSIQPATIAYVCPTCGEKTLHSDFWFWVESPELDTCRRLLKELPNRECMALEESSFCRKCRPGTNAPSINLVIRYDDRTTNVVSGITSQDLRFLTDVLSGRLAVDQVRDIESPLKAHLPRLRQLLGATEGKTITTP